MVEEKQLKAFWQQHLAGYTTSTPLVVAKTPGYTAHHVPNYQLHTVSIPNELTAVLHSFGSFHHLSPYTLVLTAWALLLNRYNAGLDDIVLGTTALAHLPACIIPLRLSILPHVSLLSWLKTVQSEHETASYYAASLPQIRQWSKLLPETALFESFVTTELTESNYPLQLVLADESTWQLIVRYDAHRLETAVISRLSGHLQTVLHSIATTPQQRLEQVQLLTPAEKQQLLVEWNQTTAEYSHELCVHDLFARQVEHVPENTAVIFENQHLTYRQLDQRATQLAHYLQSRGVGPDMLVGIYMERSLEMIIAMIGILKAGGAYVPLDPDYPPERLSFLLADTRTPILLTQAHLRTFLPSANAKIISLDSDWDLIEAANSSQPLARHATPANLACLIYTSGSTGLPRGVLLEHGPTVNLVQSFINTYHPTPDDQLVPLTSISFASFVGEFLPILCSGGTLILPNRTELLDFAAMAALLTRHHTTMISTVPTLVTVINSRRDHLPHLRLLLSGGEMLTLGDVDHLLKSVTIANGYGLTETTVCSTSYAFTREDFQENGRISENGRVPVGKPIMNTTTYILDEFLNPLPIGCPGELYVGGVGVARGYLGYPGFTSERFIPDPFSIQPGARLFKTGDKACYRADGNIEFFGRLDDQVKVRGFRIEPGEIEVTLRLHPNVQEAVVTVHEDTTRRKELNDKRLVAYVVAKPYLTISLSEIRNFLLERLPNYMVPAAFVQLPILPRTPNGKIDRRALPEPDDARLAPETAYFPPETVVEQIIAAHWQELFRVENIGIYDDFFDLGGNSLLGTQLISRLRNVYPLTLSLSQLFDAPTIAGVSSLIEELLIAKIEKMSEEEAQALLLSIGDLVS